MNRRKFLWTGAIWIPSARALSQASLRSPAFVGGLSRAAPSAGSDVPSGTLLSEDFEGTGAPSGWSGSGTIDWDESGVVLNGSQSLKLDATSSGPYVYKSFTAQSSVQYFCDFRLGGTPADFYSFLWFLNGSFGTIGSLKIGWNRKVRISPIGGTDITGTAVLSTGTNYRAWFTYTKGSGSNAVFEAWVSTTDSKSDAVEHLSASDGTATTDASYFYVAPSSGFGVLYIDRVRVDPK